MVLVPPGACRRADAARLVDVLETNRNAVQRAARTARRDVAGRGPRLVVQDENIAVQLAVERADAVEISLGQRHGGELASGDRAARLGDGEQSRVHRRLNLSGGQRYAQARPPDRAAAALCGSSARQSGNPDAIPRTAPGSASIPPVPREP